MYHKHPPETGSDFLTTLLLDFGRLLLELRGKKKFNIDDHLKSEYT